MANIKFYRGSSDPSSMSSNCLYFTNSGRLWDGTSQKLIGEYLNKLQLGTISGSVPNYSIVGGTADKAVITGIIGSTAASYISPTAPESSSICTISLGSTTKVLSTGGNAIGVMNTSGVKGYYYTKIDFTNKTITLSTKRGTSATWSGVTLDWVVGDTISFVNNSKFPACAKITAISSNVLTVDSLPFTSSDDIVSYSALSSATYTPDDFTIFACYQKPEVTILGSIKNQRWYPRNGSIELGWAATAFGVENLVTGSASFSGGWNNWSAGDFSATFGRNNISGYSALVGGQNNTISSECGFAVGKENTVTGDGSASLGYGNVIDINGRFSYSDGVRNTLTGRASRVGGENSIVSADYADAHGSGVTASGKYSFARGLGTKAMGNASTSLGNKTTTNVSSSFATGIGTVVNCVAGAAFGQYNVGYDSSVFEIGWGTSSTPNNLLTISKAGHSTFNGSLSTTGALYTSDITATSLTLPDNMAFITASGRIVGAELALGDYCTFSNETFYAQNLKATSISASESLEGLGYYSLSVGSGTQTASGKGSIALGRGNTVSGNASVALGNANINTASSSVVGGYGNEGSGAYSITLGKSNYNEADNNCVLGCSNVNTTESKNTILIGYSNTSYQTNSGSVAIGDNNLIDYTSAGLGSLQMLGSHLETNAADNDLLNESGLVIIGQYNNLPSNNASVIIANGNSKTSHNAIVIDNDNTINLNGNVYINDMPIIPLYNHYCGFSSEEDSFACHFSLLSYFPTLNTTTLGQHHHMLLAAEGQLLYSSTSCKIMFVNLFSTFMDVFFWYNGTLQSKSISYSTYPFEDVSVYKLPTP